VDSRERAINYVAHNQRPKLSRLVLEKADRGEASTIKELAAAIVDHALEPGDGHEKVTIRDLLTPGQWRCYQKHENAPVGQHREAQRERRNLRILRQALLRNVLVPGRNRAETTPKLDQVKDEGPFNRDRENARRRGRS